MPSSGKTVVRGRGLPVFCALVAAGAATGALITVIDPVGSVDLALVGTLTALVWLCWRLARSRVEFDAHGVTLVSFATRRYLAWGAVTDITHTSGLSVLDAEGLPRGVPTLAGSAVDNLLQRRGRSRVRAAADALRAARAAASPEALADTTRTLRPDPTWPDLLLPTSLTLILLGL
ncbi:hypothetical protein ACN20G_01025 [Streptomyces sp. BI20]|uniref:hypothetical protein n=1 Tax=Streptomyces sp. BI20 TaxID=3403460 RepID=UPI003C74568D